MEPGWIYLFSGIFFMGYSRICKRGMGECPDMETAFFFADTFDAYSAAGVDGSNGDRYHSVIFSSDKKGPYLEQWAAANEQLDKVSDHLSCLITRWIEKRIRKAYPKVKKVRKAEKSAEEGVFAEGCGFYKLMLLFIIGAFLGDIVETIFCRVTMGYWMSRSSLVWGLFSIVWGLALALVTLLLYKYKDHSDSFLFMMGTLLGGGYEYFCSVFTEIFLEKYFGTTVSFRLIWAAESIFCTAFSGKSRL